MNDVTQYMLWAPTLLLVAVRVAGMLLTAPVLSSPAVPLRLRIFMSLVMALAVVGRIARAVALPDNWPALGVTVAGEALIGAAIGCAAALVFAGVELAATHVAQQMGIGLAAVFRGAPGESVGTARRVFYLLAVVVFLSIGGHRSLVSALVGSFRTVPLTGVSVQPGVLNVAAALLAASFTLALKLAAPVLITLLLATVALGLLHKALPQCHILSIGFPIRAMAGMVVLAATMAVVQQVITRAWPAWVKRISELVEAMR